ncbi:TRAP transporter substrate-binding protein [Desulfotignum phosphitoxidans]|uniref:TRAP dicarboxylate transporter-DctP subunit n=1 Tax=Desulfotignum phosphitoxidans DSM 13687 TaxID=1286635 RepID=S0G6X3_9BACT|nr:TRAP transporter substrate-binding protein [Desulfotignum phosphitoxidans]EMS80391.1 TRAP dicarboxylate transporter-DctP subunit [Desulfotignum phosphitoxidans DSM 13687]
MRKSFSIFRIIFTTATLVLWGATLFAKPVTLTYSNFFPPTHVQSQLAQAWCDEVEKQTDGRVTVQYFPGQTLTKGTQNYDGVVSGLSDIGMCLFAYTRGRFPVMEAVDLPLGYDSGITATRVVNTVYEKLQPKELENTQVMYLHAHGAGLLHTSGKAIRTLEDFKGMKLRGHGTSAQMITALGGIPVSLPMPELYQSLQKNIVQGALYPIETNKGWRMGEVVDYLTLSTSIAYTSSFYVVMNKKKWAQIPDDLKPVIMEINQEWAKKHGQAWDDSDREGMEFLKSLDREVISLSDAEAARWQKAVAPVVETYIEKMNNNGFDGEKIVDLVKTTLAELKQ